MSKTKVRMPSEQCSGKNMKYMGHFANPEVMAEGHNTSWIAGAVKHPGALTKSAKKAGESTHEFAEEHKHDSGKTGARARLALTLSKLRRKK